MGSYSKHFEVRNDQLLIWYTFSQSSRLFFLNSWLSNYTWNLIQLDFYTFCCWLRRVLSFIIHAAKQSLHATCTYVQHILLCCFEGFFKYLKKFFFEIWYMWGEGRIRQWEVKWISGYLRTILYVESQYISGRDQMKKFCDWSLLFYWNCFHGPIYFTTFRSGWKERNYRVYNNPFLLIWHEISQVHRSHETKIQG